MREMDRQDFKFSIDQKLMFGFAAFVPGAFGALVVVENVKNPNPDAPELLHWGLYGMERQFYCFFGPAAI